MAEKLEPWIALVGLTKLRLVILPEYSHPKNGIHATNALMQSQARLVAAFPDLGMQLLVWLVTA